MKNIFRQNEKKECYSKKYLRPKFYFKSHLITLGRMSTNFNTRKCLLKSHNTYLQKTYLRFHV